MDFITTEHSAKDLIVSFAIIEEGSPGDVLSLTLRRTPEYEFIFDPEERGVSVDWEQDEKKNEYLLAVERSGKTVKLKTTNRRFTLDVSCVAAKELDRMGQVLRKMNFDKRLELKGI
ncbi:MAG: hypothetical protein HY673_08740 [Chloroflexi bacterium]|nr:hypothetical protein [Chloroflexota bacterium]